MLPSLASALGAVSSRDAGSVPIGKRDSLDPVSNSELGKYVLNVRPDGSLADEETAPYFLLRESLDEQLHDVMLPRSEPRARPRGRSSLATKEPAHSCEELVASEGFNEESHLPRGAVRRMRVQNHSVRTPETNTIDMLSPSASRNARHTS